MNAQTPIFRSEVVVARSERLAGAVNLAPPVTWQAIGYLLLIAVLMVGCFIATATYSRVTKVDGTIVLDTGVAALVPSRSGVVTSVEVLEGQHVQAHAPIFRIKSEDDLRSGGTAADRVGTSLQQQDDHLTRQASLLLIGAEADRMRLVSQINGAKAELSDLVSQLTDQQRLVDAASADYANALIVAQRGFVSGKDLSDRQTTVISRRQQLSQLRQAISAKRAELEGAERSISQSRALAQAQVASSDSSRAALKQQIAQNEQSRGYVITAPVEGMITALTARLGQPVRPDQTLGMVVPDRSTVRAELYVPSAAVGFVDVGQEVRLALDAFPFERFGTLKARIVATSAASSIRSSPPGSTPVYLVTAVVDRSSMSAFGHRRALLPGMTLSARIITERRSLIRWLFEPIFAVRG